ncbi:hypothetical protein LTR70_009790 [Exophiala xenobiotica]|uniref:AB hydrolase-1 domain-containing protein n=1 Tax=Lithohypha guttulata TaxID=1690604 RepID=A0ABR0JVK7_9EURO|nr:hypothetical protein LTR24_009915 [Lithohypha guttulata]KAK5310039.1 hypothetical protein LTR70_009790 [Exophiala xenobiotica]
MLISALLPLASGVLVALLSSASAQDSSNNTLPLSSDDSFNFELITGLGESTYRGGDIAPMLKAATQIKLVTPSTALRTRAVPPLKTQLLRTTASTSETLAAANYYRRADFYLHNNWTDPRITSYWDLQTTCFNAAIAALPVPGLRIQIPADGFHVEAIFYGVDPPGTNHTRPTIILGNGYDYAQEDLLHGPGFAALERGWNVITYDGPGQPSVRRNQSLGFIYDWEKVVTPVVDYLHTRTDVDTSRIVLFGNSFGGYLAARAAAFEPRLAALALDGGIWDVHAAFIAQLPPSLLSLYNSGQKKKFDAAGVSILTDTSLPSGTRWGLGQGLWSFKIKSAYDWYDATKLYTVKDITDQIQMPVWVANAEYDQFFPGQAAYVANALGSRATLHNFTGAAGYHSQSGSLSELNRVLFSWLNATLS